MVSGYLYLRIGMFNVFEFDRMYIFTHSRLYSNFLKCYKAEL